VLRSSEATDRRRRRRCLRGPEGRAGKGAEKERARALSAGGKLQGGPGGIFPPAAAFGGGVDPRRKNRDEEGCRALKISGVG